MTRHSFSITSALLISLALSTAQLASSKVRNVSASVEARQALRDIDHSAMALTEEADQLRQFTENPEYSPESHLVTLMEMKEGINRMGREVSRLEGERDSLAPWEQQAIDKVQPLLKETALNTGKAIDYFNENRLRLWGADYREYASDILRDSDQMAKTLKDYLKLAKTSAQERKLEQSLGASGDEFK